jgi:hypothetical protein
VFHCLSCLLPYGGRKYRHQNISNWSHQYKFEVVKSSEARCNKNVHYTNFVCTSYTSECWTMKTKGTTRTAAAEVKFMIRTAKYTNKPQMQWWLSKALQTDRNLTGQHFEIQNQLDSTCRQNARKQMTKSIAQGTGEETSGRIESEWVNQWANCLTIDCDDDDYTGDGWWQCLWLRK